MEDTEIKRNNTGRNLVYLTWCKLHFVVFLWMLITAQVSCWSLPRESVHVELPTDFPTDVPFYRVTSIQDNEDPLDSIVHYRVRERKASRHSRVLKINHLTGTLSVNESADVRERQGRQRRNVSAVILAFINATSNYSNNQNLKTHLNVSFAGNISSFCQPSPNLCFPREPTNFRIPESTRTHVVFDTLHYEGTTLCKNMTANYRVTKGQEFVAVSPNKGDLSLISALDAETMKSLQFEVECLINSDQEDDNSSPMYTMIGDIKVLDINDNAPTTQLGEKHMLREEKLKPFQETLSFVVSAVDKDSLKVNDFRVKIKNDSLGLFSVGKNSSFDSVGDNIGSFFSVDISSKSVLEFPGPEYSFSVVIEDASYKLGENQVIYDIVVYNSSYAQNHVTHMQFQDIYNVTLSRKSAEYSKVVGLGDLEDLQYCVFKLENKEPEDKWFGITEYSGILFVRHPHLIFSTALSVLQIGISWSCGHISGNVSVIIHLDGPGGSFRKCDKWCARYNEERACNEGCGKGSLNGLCHWKQGIEDTFPTSNYTTCSPDITFCPDGKCDELEQQDASICPQDCAVRLSGEVLFNPGDRGIRRAVGFCSCVDPSECMCRRNYGVSNGTFRSKVYAEDRELAKRLSTPWPDSVDEDITVIAYHDGSYLARDIAAIAGLASTASCGRSCVAFIFLGICCFAVTCIVLILICKMKLGKKKKHKYVGSHISLSAVPSDYIDERSSSVQDSRQLSESSSSGKQQAETKWEFPRERLILQETLGEGEFGRVVKAQAWNINGHQGYTTVAVKMLKDNSTACEQQDLISEFHLLKEVSHPNVIRLLGACTEKSGPLYIIVEYAEYGSLRSYLRKKRHLCDSSQPCTCLVPTDCFHNPTYIQPREARPCQRLTGQRKELMSFAWQIARGMAYLSDIKLVHRDLAARNVLLATGKVAKISDFGLTRDVYESDTYLKKSKGRVPVKWMAIESLEDNLYTSRSDVWSFGIVLWEIMTQGATPYPGITAEHLYHLLKAGYRMERPDRCPEEVYTVMQLCWRERPCDRPSFKELVQKLDLLLQDTVEYLDLETQFSNEEPSNPQESCSGFQRTPPRKENGQTIPEIQYAKIYHQEDVEPSLSCGPSPRHPGFVQVPRFSDDDDDDEIKS